MTKYHSVSSFVKKMGGNKVITKVLIANNGMAATKGSCRFSFASHLDFTKRTVAGDFAACLRKGWNVIFFCLGIRSIQQWAYETFMDARAIKFVVMASPEDVAANVEYIKVADECVEVL